jgi:hypothetical protein
MSRIIESLICKHCDTIYTDLFISFGHLEKDIKYKWECKKM